MSRFNERNTQGDQAVKEILARISLQLADFQRILQAMRLSGRRVVTCSDRDAKSEWLFATGDA